MTETKRIANELVTNWSKWQAAASAKTAVSKEDVKPDVKRKSVESSDGLFYCSSSFLFVIALRAFAEVIFLLFLSLSQFRGF